MGRAEWFGFFYAVLFFGHRGGNDALFARDTHRFVIKRGDMILDRIRFIKGIVKQLYADGIISSAQYSDMCRFLIESGIKADGRF